MRSIVPSIRSQPPPSVRGRQHAEAWSSPHADVALKHDLTAAERRDVEQSKPVQTDHDRLYRSIHGRRMRTPIR